MIPLESPAVVQTREAHSPLSSFSVHAGEHTIERSSKDIKMFSTKAPTFDELQRRVGDAITSVRPFYKGDETVRHLGFPQRLALPKGSRDGMPLKLFVSVTRCATKVDDDWFMKCWDKNAVMFPFDRKVMDFDVEDAPNMHFENVMVFHRAWDDATTVAT